MVAMDNKVSIGGRRFAPLTLAQQQVVLANRGLIGTMMRYGCVRGYIDRHGMDEYQSLACQCLCIAVARHDPARGTLGTIFYLILRQGIWRTEKRNKPLVLNDYNDGRCVPAVRDRNQHDAEVSETLRKCLARLTPEEIEIVRLRAGLDKRRTGNGTLVDIGRRVNRSYETVRYMLHHIAAKCASLAVLVLVLAGCGQPLVTADADLTAKVKAAVLSPEVTMALSNHIETTIMPHITAEATASVVARAEGTIIAKAEADLTAQIDTKIEVGLKRTTDQKGFLNIVNDPWPAVAVSGLWIVGFLVYALGRRHERKVRAT